MASYFHALQSHADCIEIDVSRSSDGVLFALHDRYFCLLLDVVNSISILPFVETIFYLTSVAYLKSSTNFMKILVMYLRFSCDHWLVYQGSP